MVFFMARYKEQDSKQGEVHSEAGEKILRAVRTGETTLDLSGFGLTVLPPEIGQCTKLETLVLKSNKLTALPKEIGQCVHLHMLSLDNNEPTSLPKEIGQCLHLHTLSVDNNQLTELPKEIVQCTNLRVLSIHGNPVLGLPPEVLGPAVTDAMSGEKLRAHPRAVFDYYFSRRARGTQPLDEVKLVLVGRGGTGKTSLVERLVWNRFQPGRAETLGVALSDWRMQDCAAGPVTAHIWDFAGQTITHAMHQFFLSVRTVYVLVLTGRENSERDDAEYWLRLIAAYGTEAGKNGPPVIVALNKWDDQGSAHARVDRVALRERYPFIVDFVETDCATGAGIPKLRELLHATVDPLPWVRADFPNDYRRVKDRLEAVPSPHLPYDEYRRICSECGVAEKERQDLLAENLHALGVALNFRKDARLSFASVLKPHWLTDHVYALVRHAELKSGVLYQTALATVLADEKDPAIRQFLVEMMVLFELAYPLAEEGAAPTAWLVPQALPDSQPAGMEAFRQSKDATRLRYTYRALPVSIVPRFIVRAHPFIEAELRWASGVVLTLNGARALVRADYAEKQVEITVTGLAEVRRELIGLAQQEFRYINGQITGLNPSEETEEQGRVGPGEDAGARRGCKAQDWSGHGCGDSGGGSGEEVERVLRPGSA